MAATTKISKYKFWTAAVTRFSQEQRAAHHVERQGFEFYIPRIQILNARFHEVSELLFPGYIFVRVDTRAAWRVLASTRGISRMFLCDEIPTRIPDIEINSLRSSEDERGYVQLLPPLGTGANVVGLEGAGAYAGVRGIVRGTPARNRVSVLLSILGHGVEVDLDRRVVEAA